MTRLSLLAALALVAGCSSSAPQTNGPLVTGTDRGQICVPAAAGVVSVGEPLRLNGSDPARIDSISLVSPHDMTLIDADLVPITGNNGIGTAVGYPPPPEQLASVGIGWTSRVGVDGAIVASVPTWDLVVGIALAGQASTGKADSISVKYTVRDKQYEVFTSDALVVQRSSPCAA